MKNLRMPLAVIVGLFACSSAFAQTDATAPAAPAPAAEEAAPVVDSGSGSRGLGVGIRASTLGAGVELIYNINRNLNLRGQANFISLSRSMKEDGVDYDGKLDFQTFGVLADYHPFAGSFRITGGLYQNGNEIGMQASCPPPNGCEVGDVIIRSDTSGTGPSGQAGMLTGKIDFNSTAPYLGIGWGNAMKGSALHFGFDIGVLFQGSPKVDLAADGDATVQSVNPPGPQSASQDIGSNGTVQTEVADEEQRLQGDVNEFKLFPVIAFTLGYRFNF